MINLFIINVSKYLNVDKINSFKKSMSLSRINKIDNHRLIKDKALSLGAGLLLNYISNFYSLDDIESNIEINQFGKEYLPNNQVYFNISHCFPYAICCVSNQDIGCDIEKIDPAKIKIASRFFTPNEFEFIKNNEGEEGILFTRIWTIKESYLKLFGTGLTKSLNSFEVIHKDKNYYVYDDKQIIKANTIDYEKDYIISFCTYDKDSLINVIEVKI